MRRLPIKAHENQRKRLERDVEAFLARGKQIEQLPSPPERAVGHRVGHGNSWGVGGVS